MAMYVQWVTALVVLATATAGKSGKHRHHKPGRAVLDHLASTIVVEDVSSTDSPDTALLPAPLDASPFVTISANATCGDLGAEDYCRDMPGKRGIQCGVCEGSDGASSRRHPASHAVDGDMSSWWQSPTLATGDQYQDVALVLTLPDEMDLLHVIIKSGPSSRPLAWSLETSQSEDGEDWRMVRAFGDKESCRRLWSLRPERRRRRVRRAKPKRTHRAEKIACSTQFASPKPLENGEMHVGLGRGVPARRVRMSLRAIHPGLPERRFYTVRAITLAARCICNGHASSCTVTQQGAMCDCSHDTCGAHCERCCAGTPWRAGTACSPAYPAPAPDSCHCGERGACSYDDTGAVVCVNCTENRGGPLCEHCLPGHYSVEADGPCLTCNCNPQGSDGSCEWSPTSQSVTCACREGFSGDRCDECLHPDQEYPDCRASGLTSDVTSLCKCDPRGIVEGADVCDTTCRCKERVLGERCDTCAPGHYGLSAELREGCRKCYCSGVTDICSAHPEPSASMMFPAESWRVRALDGEHETPVTFDQFGRPYLAAYDQDSTTDVYWTTDWSGAGTFGSRLLAASRAAIARGDAGGEPTTGADVVIVTHDGYRVAYGGGVHETPGEIVFEILLTEDGWYELKNGNSRGEDITRAKMMRVLEDAKELMLRASFHMDQEEVRLLSAEVLGSSGGEQCACPAEYSGASCERCAPAHVRHGDVCRACPCGGHADCHPVTLECLECRHNRTGPHCELCAEGYFGPVDGVCVPCACPALDGGGPPACVQRGDDFVCTQCPAGHIGDHCEKCADGYWGSAQSGGCRSCACGGGPCQLDTGRCVLCPARASGPNCDRCEEGYWLSRAAGAGACVPCACGAGAVRPTCDTDGTCRCRDGWAGRTCDTCDEGHGDVSAGCPSCRCGTAGAGCARESGECVCARGAAPPHCADCLPHHYNLTAEGCTGCNCSSVGSIGGSCDIRTGQCRCREHVTGRACDVCQEGYWGLTSGGCRRCSCGAGACDPDTGACACGPGATGPACELCLPGYYGFGPNACKPCPTCGPGEVCHPVSGRCVCPARAAGPGCRACVRAAWGPPDCRPCVCGRGALHGDCDQASGQCRCGPGWAGRACDVCAPGHWGPRCRPCACHAPGTRPCGDRPCDCDYNGRCHCKENVQGDKCDVCRAGTFGLSADNPHGCTACFCFGRSARCSQAGLTRVPLAAPDLNLTITTDTNPPHQYQSEWEGGTAVRVHGPHAVVAARGGRPLYVDVGARWSGDRVTSYGGLLTYRATSRGGVLEGHADREGPLVRIYGGHALVLDYYQRVPPVNDTYLVRLHESLWRAHVEGAVESGGEASRTAMMAALSDVRRVLLRVTTRVPTPTDHVHVAVWNVSLEVSVPSGGRSRPALGVEMCACGPAHTAASCHRPAPGYWQPAARATLAAGTIVISLPDTSACHCHGRATQCHPATGHCLNCTSGYGGPQCERCADGYERAGDGCAPCECPTRGANRAASCWTQHAAARTHLYCQCLPGYAGARCERCAAGYWRHGADCVPCACGPRGLLAGPASATDDVCRTHAAQGLCLSCDNCTASLLASVSTLSRSLASVRGEAAPRPPPPSRALDVLVHNATSLQAAATRLAATLTDTAALNDYVMDDLENGMKSILEESISVSEQCGVQRERAGSLLLEALSAEDAARAARGRLEDAVGDLRGYTAEGGRRPEDDAVREGRALLRAVKDVRLDDYVTAVHDVADQATLQLTWVQERAYLVERSWSVVRAAFPRLERVEARAEDAAGLADRAWDVADAAAAAIAGARRDLTRTDRDRRDPHRLRHELMTLSRSNITGELEGALESAMSVSGRARELCAELRAVCEAARHKEGVLYGLTPLYRRDYLHAAETHVAQLREKAQEYISALKQQAVSAGAAGRIASELAGARAAASAALRVAATATNVWRGGAGGAGAGVRGAVERVRAAHNRSRTAQTRAHTLLRHATELGASAERWSRELERVRLRLRALGWAERALVTDGGGGAREVDGAALAAVRGAGGAADRVFVGARALHEEAAGVRRATAYGLRRVLLDLQRHGDTALGAAQELVSQIRGDGTRAREVAGALAGAAAAREAEHRSAQSTLRPALDSLRATAERARHAADSICVSLTSGVGGTAGCSRAYNIQSSPTVSRVWMALTLEAGGGTHGGPLFEWGDLALSLDPAGRATLHWGGGELQHPTPLRREGEDRPSTYTVHVDRVWNRLSLRIDDGTSSLTVSNSSGSRWASPPVDNLWVGAAGAGARSRAGERGGLPVCLHALEADGRRVGLWNFVRQPPGASCTGCPQRYYAGAEAGGMAWFSGHGSYAEVSRAGHRPYDVSTFSLALSYRTTDRHALLFAAHDADNNRSISLFLRSCRVVFLVEYAGARLELEGGSGNGPCAGRLVHVQAVRLFHDNTLEKGSLRVDGSETLGSPSPPVRARASLPALHNARYWLGGLPPGVRVGGAVEAAGALRGCVGAVLVDRRGYDPLDSARRWGVRAGCAARAEERGAGLRGEGRVELPCGRLGRAGALGVTWAARAPDGLLLLRTYTRDDPSYLALQMDDGALEVSAWLGRGAPLRMRSGGARYDDGRTHSARIQRKHNTMELWVDEELVASGNLSGGAYPAREEGLFLGGLGEEEEGVPTHLRGAPFFSGTISDLIVDAKLVGLETAVRWSGASLGRWEPSPATNPSPAPPLGSHARPLVPVAPPTPPRCAPPPSHAVVAGAIKLGDAPGSHAALRLATKDVRQLDITVEFRTFRQDGLLLFIPGTKAKPKHYLALVLERGSLRLVVRGRRRKDLLLAPGPGASWQGRWVTVRVRAGAGRVSLHVEGSEATGRARAAISPRLFVGGVAGAAGGGAGGKWQGLVGCVRGLVVGGAARGQAGGARGAGQCAPHVEPAAYLGGDAHAVTRHEVELPISMQFKTSSESGILAAHGDLVLELRGGAVHAGGGGAVGVGSMLCDGGWHAVWAGRGEDGRLLVGVDGAPPVSVGAPAGPLGERAVLTVGGVGEGRAGEDNLRGCVRDVRAGGRPESLDDMRLVNVLLDACPDTAHHHSPGVKSATRDSM